jgi:hypothetical protein
MRTSNLEQFLSHILVVWSDVKEMVVGDSVVFPASLHPHLYLLALLGRIVLLSNGFD